MLGRLTHDPNASPAEIRGPTFALAASGRREDEFGACTVSECHVVFRGRIRWQDAELRQIAEQRGHPHALLEGYLRSGPAFLVQLHGPFALAIVDDRDGSTLLAIDRLGIEPLFYDAQDRRVVFGTDARAITAHPATSDDLSPQALFDYLYFHMVPSPRCIFAQQEKLLPGEYMVFRSGQVDKAFYWLPTYLEDSAPSQPRLEELFLNKLEGAVAAAADHEKVGAFLSGGTDSSTVAGMLRKVAGKPVDTYSIGFHAEGFDETEYARIAARHFDTRPHEYYVTPADVVDAIPMIAAAYDEPFGNASAVPAYFCARMAKKDGIEVLLAGDGGDELFAGNARYATQKIFEYYQRIPSALRRSVIERATENERLAGLPLFGKVRNYVRHANTPLPDRLENFNLLNRIPLGEIFPAECLARVDTHDPLILLREHYQRARAETSLNRMLFLDLKFTLADNDLRKVNRMCALAGVDVRYPLLDQELFDFSTALPSSFKLKGHRLRYFFKQSLKNFLPREILYKSKHGFGLPFGLWMKTHQPLEAIARQSLANLADRGQLQPDFIARIMKLHEQHPNYYGVMVWVLMMLEQWLRANE
jgi:asparagine synthase (glutamine-hydrolysing)